MRLQKIQTFCTAKETINKTKKNTSEYFKIFEYLQLIDLIRCCSQNNQRMSTTRHQNNNN